MKNIKIIITDMDGTLLQNDQTVSSTDMNTLYRLGEQKYTRVLATGRNYFSMRKVLPDNFPVDYVIFSSGAGIMSWPEKKLLITHSLSAAEVAEASEVLLNSSVDFAILATIPGSQFFWYHLSPQPYSDFMARMNIYSNFNNGMIVNGFEYPEASQVLAILPPDITLFKSLSEQIHTGNIIRATSPLDHRSIWLEVFPSGVSKGSAVDWLSQYCGCSLAECVSIGNDYNDVAMLEITEKSFVVANAPQDLKEIFSVCNSNTEHGFTDAVIKSGASL